MKAIESPSGRGSATEELQGRAASLDGISADGLVVYLIAPAESGGAEAVVIALARARLSAGRRVHVITLGAGDEHPFVRTARADGIPLTQLGAGHRKYRQQVDEIATELKQLGASLLHTHIYHADVVGYFAARRVGIPVVSTVHGITGTGLKNWLYIWVDFHILRRFDAVACVSEPLRERLLSSGIKRDRLRLVPNGFETHQPLERDEARRQLGLEADSRVIGWIGRLSEEKGPDLLVDAIAPIVGDGVEAVVIGDGPEREATEARVRSAGKAEHIRLVGAIPGAASYLSALDVLVLSSRTEANPMVMLEAMAAEVPVVSFAVGGIPDVLSNDSGWVVPSMDPADLGAAIRHALGDRDEAIRRAENAKEIHRVGYSFATWLANLDELYGIAKG